MNKSKEKIWKLRWLNPKDKFKFVNLTNFRHMMVKYVSDCGVIVSGEMRNGKDADFKTVGNCFSMSGEAEVYLINEDVS